MSRTSFLLRPHASQLALAALIAMPGTVFAADADTAPAIAATADSSATADTASEVAAAPAAEAEAESAPEAGPDEIVIFARGEALVGKAGAASEGAVGGADLSVRPLLRVAELLEAVPGLIAAQHSGSGKANQYFLRGFNLDHGTDFTMLVDGMPWNMRSHGHGQGYLDVNGLIPEAVERIDYRKGPYRADLGDFAMAGASFVSTIKQLDQPFVSGETGGYGWRRLAAGGSHTLGDGVLTSIAQWKTYDGPWELPENLHHGSIWNKYLQQTELGALSFTLSGYYASWHPSEQIPERVIGTSACEDVFCDLDSSATGKTSRWIATAQLVAEDWQGSAYLQHYDWHMLSNSTYDYQIRQFDRRNTVGGRLERALVQRETLSVKIGGETRYDDIGKVGLDHTDDANFVDNIGDNAIREASAALYSEASWTPLSALRLMAGLRGDVYDFDVKDQTDGEAVGPLLKGHEHDELLSPKFGAAYTLSQQIELYANWGRGFHSNDARGVVDANTPVKGLGKGTGYEAGARFELGSFKLTTTAWWLNLDSELKFVGDSNSVEPGPSSKRRGYELVGFWRPYSWLGIDAVYASSHARADNGGDNHIAGAVESAGEFGMSAVQGAWEGSARLRYLGPYPLLEDNSERADDELTLNLRLAYKPGAWTLYGELLNAFDHDGKDIVYWYGTNVAGVDAAPNPDDLDATRIEGRVSRAVEPRTVRVGLKYEF